MKVLSVECANGDGEEDAESGNGPQSSPRAIKQILDKAGVMDRPSFTDIFRQTSLTDLFRQTSLTDISRVIVQVRSKVGVAIPAGGALVMGAVAALIAYCQLLDTEPIDVRLLTTDPRGAMELFLNPVTSAKCLDSLKSVCNGQYIGAVFFLLIALYLFYLFVFCSMYVWGYDYDDLTRKISPISGCFHFCRRKWCGESGHHGGSSQFLRGSLSNLTRESTGSIRTSVESLAEALDGIVTKSGPGQAYFWPLRYFCLVSEVSMQSARCFGLGLVADNYAEVSAEYTIIQFLLIVTQIIFTSWTFYYNSELAYTLFAIIFDIGYLSVRWSLSGMYTMRANGFVDFLSLMFPLAFVSIEITALLHFVANRITIVRPSTATDNRVIVVVPSSAKQHSLENDGTATAEANAENVTVARRHSASSNSRKTFFGLIITCVCLVAGSVGFVTFVIRKNDNQQQCSDILHDLSHEGEEDSAETSVARLDAVICFNWQFNLYVDSGCSCVYSMFSDVYGCLGFGDNPDQKQIQDAVLPLLRNTRFLRWEQQNPSCVVNEDHENYEAVLRKDFDSIASFTRLRMLHWLQFHYSEVPLSWKFGDLQSIYFQKANQLTNVSTSILNAWPRLEHFSCVGCPHLETVDAFSDANLPRLQTLELYNTPACPHRFGDVDLTCVPNSANQTCSTIPEWILVYIQRNLASVGTESGCFVQTDNRSSCEAAGYFQDADHNGVINRTEITRFLNLRWLSAAADTQYLTNATGIDCLMGHIHSASLFRTGLYEGIATDGSDGLISLIQLLASVGDGMTSCGDCGFVQERMRSGQEIWESQQLQQESQDPSDTQEDLSSSLPASCQVLASEGDWNVYQAFVDMCDTTETACVGLCSFGPSFLAGSTANGTLSESAAMAVLAAGGVTLAPGMYECWADLSPQCMWQGGRWQVEARRVLAWGVFLFDQSAGASDCTDCPDYPQEYILN